MAELEEQSQTKKSVPECPFAPLYPSYINKNEEFFMKLAGASEVTVTDNATIENAVSVVTEGAQILIPLGELVDLEKEKERLLKEKERILSEIARVDGKLSNQGFVSKAPAALIEAEKAKKVKYEEMLKKVEESLGQ